MSHTSCRPPILPWSGSAALPQTNRRLAVLEALKSNPELPTPPAIALQVIEKASDPDCDPADLAEIIGKDPALCVKVLRTVNSAIYGLRSPMSSIPAAARFLGIHPLRSLVLAFTLANVRWSPLPRQMLQNHWRVSVTGALAARQLAILARRPAPDNDLVAGLVRDLGTMVLNQLFPEEYKSILESSPGAFATFQCELEEEALGVHHAEVSAELLQHWRLPPEITEPVRFHHDLERANELSADLRDRARLLYLASQIGQMQLASTPPLLFREVLGLASEFCQMDEVAFHNFLESVKAQVADFAAVLDVDVGESVNLSQVVSRGTEEFARLALHGSGRYPAVDQARATPAAASSRGEGTLRGSPLPSDSGRREKANPLEELHERLFPGPKSPGKLGQLDGYEVTKLLGSGAMGAVFLARDPQLERLVAIKALLPTSAGDSHARDRFLQEGRAVAALAHENVVRVHAVGEKAGVPYLVMEYVAGQTLEEKLRPKTPLPLPDVLRVGLDTASGLAAAHTRGLIHRDIKPANLLVDTQTGRVKIADFGIVQVMGKARLSQMGRLIGTPSFMSPEQAEGALLDVRTDLFSLGSVLYLLSTGQQPFQGTTVLEMLQAVVEVQPPPLRAVNPSLPAWLEEVVAGLLTKDPKRRYPTASELKRLLLCRWARLYVNGRAEGVNR